MMFIYLSKMFDCACLVAQLYLTLCNTKDYSLPGSSVHGFPRQEHWSKLPFPSSADLPNPWIEPTFPVSPASSGGFYTTVPPRKGSPYNIWILGIHTKDVAPNFYFLRCSLIKLEDINAWFYVWIHIRKYYGVRNKSFLTKLTGGWNSISNRMNLTLFIFSFLLNSMGITVFSSVAHLCPALWEPMDRSTPASLSITNSRSSLKLMSIESVMPPSHLIICRPLLLLPPIPPSIRVFSNESILRMRWPKYWSFSFSIIPSNEHPGLISFRKD